MSSAAECDPCAGGVLRKSLRDKSDKHLDQTRVLVCGSTLSIRLCKFNGSLSSAVRTFSSDRKVYSSSTFWLIK